MITVEPHFFTNQEIADLLRKVAAAYEVKGESQFRIRAYQTAAASVEHSTSDLKDLWDEEKLEDIPGIGKNLASYLDELFRYGKVKHFAKIMTDLPPAMFVFEKIPGVGPKKSYALAQKLNIVSERNSLERLKDAALKGRVRELEGFGEESEKDLLRGIESLEKGEQKTQRMPLYLADSLAQKIIAYLKKNSLVIEAHPLGSLRRMLATVGDIDISVSTNSPQEVLNYFFAYPLIKRIVSKGEKALGRVILKSGQQVDIRISSPESYGAMLQYFTGSKQHNILLREYALRKGLSLSEYGIKKVKTQKAKVKSFANEEDFYRELGLEWIPPEIREGTNEIEVAIKGQLPQLIEVSQIRGDLHLHSSFPIEPSHDVGESEVTEMILMAEKMNYEYIGFSEHNPSTSQHSPKEIIDLIKRKKEYIEEKIYSQGNSVKIRGKNLPVKVFHGLEIDIKPTGNLHMPEKIFDFLDYVIVSVHSSFKMERAKMTERILNGLAHHKVKILGHPTGRMIGQREGYELDWEKIFDFCLKNNKFLEISAWPNRLDLPDELVREAVKFGVKLVVNSDSHEVSQMELMKYGVAVARRGWAEKKDIINSLPLGKFSDILEYKIK